MRSDGGSSSVRSSDEPHAAADPLFCGRKKVRSDKSNTFYVRNRILTTKKSPPLDFSQHIESKRIIKQSNRTIEKRGFGVKLSRAARRNPNTRESAMRLFGPQPAERSHVCQNRGPPQAGGCGPPIPYGIKPFGSKLRPADPSRDRNRSAADHDPPTAAPPNRSSGKGARRPAAPVFSRNAPLLKCFIFNFACFHAPPSSARSLFGNDAHGFQQIFTIFAGLNHR